MVFRLSVPLAAVLMLAACNRVPASASSSTQAATGDRAASQQPREAAQSKDTGEGSASETGAGAAPAAEPADPASAARLGPKLAQLDPSDPGTLTPAVAHFAELLARDPAAPTHFADLLALLEFYRQVTNELESEIFDGGPLADVGCERTRSCGPVAPVTEATRARADAIEAQGLRFDTGGEGHLFIFINYGQLARKLDLPDALNGYLLRLERDTQEVWPLQTEEGYYGEPGPFEAALLGWAELAGRDVPGLRAAAFDQLRPIAFNYLMRCRSAELACAPGCPIRAQLEAFAARRDAEPFRPIIDRVLAGIDARQPNQHGEFSLDTLVHTTLEEFFPARPND